MFNIRKIVCDLMKKYDTKSPYELCKILNIEITRSELGAIRGFYHYAYRVKQIYLNCNLTREEEEFVLAHELGHAILHPTSNTPFLTNKSFLSVDKMEIEANKFAMELLVSDEMINEFKHFTLGQLKQLWGYEVELLQLRLCKYI